MKNYTFKKLKCFFTEEIIFRYYNVTTDSQRSEANDDFAWSKEHLISRTHLLFKELDEQEKLKNIVDTARIINSNLNDAPLYIKLIIKEKFLKQNTTYNDLYQIKKIFNKITKEVCKKYNFDRGISFKENELYHTEIDKLVYNHHFKKDKFQYDLNAVPVKILNMIKKETYFIKNDILSKHKTFSLKIFNFTFKIEVKW